MIIFLKFVLALAIAGLCGLLGSWAGADGTSKNWRRLGIPIVLTPIATIALVIQFGWLGLLGLSTFLLWPPLTMGYGIPSPGDEGSPLGRFFYNLFNKNEFLANVFTRGTINLLCCLTYLIIPILTGAWLIYILCSALVIFNAILWGAIIENEGMFEFLGKKLLWEEFYRYAGLGGFLSLMSLVS
jgi:hypothetical protein